MIPVVEKLLIEALIEARKTLGIASSALTEEHRLVLNGKVWGASALAKIDTALAAAREEQA